MRARRLALGFISAVAIVMGLASAASAAISATEGQSFSGRVLRFDGACAPFISATIDWGDQTTSDGSATQDGTGVQGTHTYAEDGSYNGSVSYDCGHGPVTGPFQATVQDAALTGTGQNSAGTAGQPLTAVVAHIDDANPGGTADDFSATIDWGDGSSSSGSVAAAAGGVGFDVTGTHTYATAGPFTVGTTISDVGGSTTTASSTAQIASAAAVVHTLGVDQITTTGARVFGTINDGGAAVTYRIAYGQTTAYGSSTPDAMTSGSGTDTPVQAVLQNLTPDTDYHAQVVADGPGGSVVGEDVAFHTAQSVTLPGLPPGLDFTWSPKADVLVAGAPSAGVQFSATPGPGMTYRWAFDSPPASVFSPDPAAVGATPRHAFTADGAHDTDKVQGANGERRRLYSVRLHATAANGASVDISHDLVVAPNAPPQVDFAVGGEQDVNKPTVFTPVVSDPAGPRVANHVDHIEWSFDTPTAGRAAGDPSATDLICAPDGSACHLPGGGKPGPWFSQGDGHQAVVNFYQRALAAHGLPELSTLNLNALPQKAPDGTPLTGGLRVFDGRGEFTVFHDLRVAYLYDNATLLQQSTFALDAGEATGARLKSGAPLAGDVTPARRAPGALSSAFVVPYSTQVEESDPALRVLQALAGRQLDWRHVTLTAVDTAGVRTSLTRPVPLRAQAPPDLRARFVDESAATITIAHRKVRATADRQVIDHPLTTADELAFDASGTSDPSGRIAYYTLEVGKPQGCREPDKHQQQRYAGLPVFNSIDPPVDGYRPGEFFTRPAVGGAGRGLAVGRTGQLITASANPRNILNIGFGGGAGAHAHDAADASGLPTLGEKLARGRVVHSCSGGVSSYFFHSSDSFAARNVFPTVFMTRQGAAARPPVVRRGRVSSSSRARRSPLEYATSALVTSDPSKLRFRIPNPGVYSVTVAAYNAAGLGAIQRTDNFEIQSPAGRCDDVAGQVTLGGKQLGFTGQCVEVGANRRLFWTGADLTINGVAVRPLGGAHLFLDTRSGRNELFATTASLPGNLGSLSDQQIAGLDQHPASVQIVFERDPIARFSSFSSQIAAQFVRGASDPAVFTGATYHGSPVAMADNGGSNPNTFHVAFTAKTGDSTARFMIVLPKEFSSEAAAAAPTSDVVRNGHTDVPATELTTNHFATIAAHRAGEPRARAASGVSGSLSLTDAHIGPLFINKGTLSFDSAQDLWRGDIQDAYLEMWPTYKVSFHILIQNGALRELGGQVQGLDIPVFAGVFLNAVRFSIVTDPLTLSGGASFTALGGALTGDLDMIIRTKPVFLRLEGRIAIASLALANAYVQYDQANADTVSFGGHFGYNFGPVSMSADLNGAISGDTGDFFIEGNGEVCVGICYGSGAILSNIAVALCGSVHLGPLKLSAGAAYVFKPGKLEVFTGCDLEPYKPAIFRVSRDAAGGSLGRVHVAADPLPVAAGTQEVAFRFHGDPSVPGAPSVTLISPTGRHYETAPTAGDYTFVSPVAGPSGVTQVGGALIDRDPVDHVTTAIIAEPPAGNWQFETPPGQPPLVSVETARGTHIPDDAFKASIQHAAVDAAGDTVRTRAYTASLSPERIRALRRLPALERGRLVSAQISIPAGLTGGLKLIDVGPASVKPIENIDLGAVGNGTDTSSRKVTIVFAPTDEPGPHQIQAVKFQSPGARALPQRTFVVGGYIAPAVPTPSAPGLDVHRDGAGRLLVDVTPGSAGSLTGNTTTFELVASTAAGQRIEEIVYAYQGLGGRVRHRRTSQAQPLPGGRFRVILDRIPISTTVEVFGRMQYASTIGRVSSVRLRCSRCAAGQ